MTLIGEAGRGCDFGQRSVGSSHPLRCVLDPQSAYIFAECAILECAENASHMGQMSARSAIAFRMGRAGRIKIHCQWQPYFFAMSKSFNVSTRNNETVQRRFVHMLWLVHPVRIKDLSDMEVRQLMGSKCLAKESTCGQF